MGLPPPADALPATLVDRDQWVCWQTHQRDDNPTKVPIVPGTTRFASTTDPDSWRTFQTAREAVTTTPVAGLGFVFTADDPLIGIDLDDCRDPETGDPTAWADRIISQLESYTEVSPSGTGYHILVTGTLPEGRNRAGDLELYDRSRFFTVTGDHVDETPTTIAERAQAVATLHAAEVATDASDASSPETAGTGSEPTVANADPATYAATTDETAAATVPDDELVARAKDAANGAKFTRLWNGNTSGYESHSEADMALCRLLAFWTGCESRRVDRLFRQSGLYRDKWDAVHYADGSTYGDKTVERAIANTDEVYTPPEAAGSTADRSGSTAGNNSAGSDTQLGTASDSDQQTTSATTDSATPRDSEADSTTLPADTGVTVADVETSPAGHPQRAQARRARIDELTDRVESLLAENERLRQELHDERERRQELEETSEETPDSWWPL